MNLNPDFLIALFEKCDSEFTIITLCTLSPKLWIQPATKKWLRVAAISLARPNVHNIQITEKTKPLVLPLAILVSNRSKNVEQNSRLFSNLKDIYLWLLKNNLFQELDTLIEKNCKNGIPFSFDWRYLRNQTSYSKEFILWLERHFWGELNNLFYMEVVLTWLREENYDLIEWLLGVHEIVIDGKSLSQYLLPFGTLGVYHENVYNCRAYQWFIDRYGVDLLKKKRKSVFPSDVVFWIEKKNSDVIRYLHKILDLAQVIEPEKEKIIQTSLDYGEFELFQWLEREYDSHKYKIYLLYSHFPKTLKHIVTRKDAGTCLEFYQDYFGVDLNEILLSKKNLTKAFGDGVLEFITWLIARISVPKIREILPNSKIFNLIVQNSNEGVFKYVFEIFKISRRDMGYLPVPALVMHQKAETLRYIQKKFNISHKELYYRMGGIEMDFDKMISSIARFSVNEFLLPMFTEEMPDF